MNYRLLALTLAVAACGRGSGGSPTCGIAFLAGPSLITQQLGNARAVLTDPPRGVPDSLPALVILQKTRDIGAVLVGRDGEGRISMQYRGSGFPQHGYGLLVVDDTSQRTMGVLTLDTEEPQDRMERVRLLADLPEASRPKVRVVDPAGPWFKAQIARVRAAKGAEFTACDVDIPAEVK